MKRHIFTHWEAIELFARIVSKKESQPLEKYYNYFNLHKLVKNACKEQYSAEITSAINSALGKDKSTKSLSGKDIFNLANAIENRIPFTITDLNYDVLNEYVGEADFFKRIKSSKKFEVKEKRMAYEGTIWSIYFYDEINENSTGVKRVISRGILKFLPFSKVEIIYFNSDTSQIDYYMGNFLNSEGGDYFILELKTKIGEHKDLKIQLNTSRHSMVPLALGIYCNGSDKMLAGSVVIEKETAEESALAIKTYELQNEDDRNALGKDYIWKFFTETETYISMPIGVNSSSQVMLWLKNRSK